MNLHIGSEKTLNLTIYIIDGIAVGLQPRLLQNHSHSLHGHVFFERFSAKYGMKRVTVRFTY